MKPEWFGGNEDAIEIYQNLVAVTHIWDSIVDGDDEKDMVNEAFKIALIDLPANKLYREIYPKIHALFVCSAAGYETANELEKTKDEHSLEISHSLRYAAGHILVFLSIYCLGYAKSRKYHAEMWKTIIPERYANYLSEHGGKNGS